MKLITVSLYTRESLLSSDIVYGLSKHENIRLVSLAYDRPLKIPDVDVIIWDLGDLPDGEPELPGTVASTAGTILFLAEPDSQYDYIRPKLRNMPVGGFLRRKDAVDRIAAAVQAVAAGLTVYPVTYVPAAYPDVEMGEDSAELTPREIRILRAVASGEPSKAIASGLGISERTVKFHLASLYRKMGVQNRTEAAVEGTRRGLVPL